MLLKGFWKILLPLADNGSFRFFLFVIAAKPLNQQILAFFSILLVSRLRLTCSVCDGTLETSYWKCRQWVLRVCKLANIQIFIFYGHFGAKNHCCTVYTGISRFSIFEEVWWKVVFSVKSWETSRLYHVQEHSFGFHFEPKWIDFRQKLKFLAYFEIRDGKIRKNAYFPYKMRKKAILSHFSGHEGGFGIMLGFCKQHLVIFWAQNDPKWPKMTQNDPKMTKNRCPPTGTRPAPMARLKRP